MKGIILIFVSFLFLQNHIEAQSFELKNNIEIIVKQDGNQCLVHTVEQKQTLYNISRLYNIPINTLLDYNKLDKNDLIYQGNKIYIPLNHKIYSKKIKPNKKGVHLRPVVYTIRSKDSFYGITHRYFNIDEGELIKNNALSSKNLQIGQNLIIGWIALKDNYSEWAASRGSDEENIHNQETNINPSKNNKSEKEFHNQPIVNTIPIIPAKHQKIESNDTDIPSPQMPIHKSTLKSDSTQNLAKNDESPNPISDKKFITNYGIAMWNKNSSDKSNSFVLHASAKINSIIELYNPLTKRTAYAKVIAHIPDNTYQSDISILISPKVAERLGALDERFKIKMIYYK